PNGSRSSRKPPRPDGCSSPIGNACQRDCPGDRPGGALVRGLDAFAARANRARAARAEGCGSFPPDRHAMESLEGPQEENRLAALSRLLLPPLPTPRATPGFEVYGRREHHFVRG